MAKFAVYSGEILVGHSMLESGDAPMGIAFGVFVPSEAYSKIQQVCATGHANQSALRLSIKTEEGATVPCAGVGILDYSAESEPRCIEVNVLGIPHPLYGELFPGHIANYERKFNR